MADLVTTIKVDSKQFDNSIKSSTNQVRQFERENYKTGKQVEAFGGKITSIASGALMGMASSIGLAYGAMEVFNGAIKSTQTTADDFDKKIAQAKGSVDYFFQSIAQGDFSNFFNGLDGAIRRAGNLYEIIDSLGDKMAAWDDISSQKKFEITENRAKIEDSDTSTEERKRLVAENEKLINELAKANSIVNSEAKRKVKGVIESAANLDDVTDKEVDIYLQEISLGTNKEFNWYSKRRKELEKASKETTTEYGYDFGQTTQKVPTDEAVKAKKELAALKEKYSKRSITLAVQDNEGKWSEKTYDDLSLERLYKINDLVVDAVRKEVVAERGGIRGRSSDIANLKRQNSRDSRKKFGDTGNGKPEDIFPTGSLSDYDKEIKEVNQKISLTVDESTRRILYKELEELERQKRIIRFRYQREGGDIADITNDVSTKVNTSPIKDISNVKITAPELPKIAESQSSMEAWNSTMNKIREDNWGTIESFNGISMAMSAIGDASDGSAAAMFKWAATTLGAIGQAIPAIMALTVAKEVEANASAKAAAAGAASSVAAIPIVGGILAVAAIASVVAAMTSIPKFAEGGLVYGNTIAQVGEYAGASNNPEVIAPLSKLRKILSDSNEGNGIGGSVEFKIAGKDLVGTINNYSSKQRKK